MASYAEMGCQLLLSEEPFAIVVLTEIMLRAHSLPDAANVCFVDSTASCDVDNHSITFMLTTCAVGAVPLAVIITSSQNESAYTAGFQLLRDCGRSLFGGAGYPQVFLTDDSSAEQNALKTTWMDSTLRLCLFHVAQANWRWLWESKNGITKEDRPHMMEEFRKVMQASTEVAAEEQFATAVSSDSSKQYEHWRQRLQCYWQRREQWCVAWRSPIIHRGQNTNNYSEVTVRIFKDTVLSRSKAYNAVALVDFICTTMENYYSHRLLDYAHSRVSPGRLWLRHQAGRAAYVSKEMISQTAESVFAVQSESESDMWYSVDVAVGVCSCDSGVTGKFCKHQAAVLLHFPGMMDWAAW